MKQRARSEIYQALLACKTALIGVGFFSAMINILMLTGAFYMLQVYDRVLTSSSVPTLIVLSILAVFLLLVMGVLDMIRSRLMVRIGASLDQRLSKRVFESLVKQPLKQNVHSDGLQPVRDLDAIRSFLASPGPLALFDTPWVPIYIAIIFAFHFLLGITAVVGAAILIILAICAEFFTRRPSMESAQHAQSRGAIALSGKRNAEVLTAMGMRERIFDQWQNSSAEYIANQTSISDISGGFGAISKALRMILQSAMLGVGAYLVINQQASSGIIIAGAILSGRALAPVDQAIGQWRGFVSARQSWRRLNEMLLKLPQHTPYTALPPPSKSLSAEAVVAAAPGGRNIILKQISFEIEAGNSLGIIGTSGAGKSSLARLLVGAWQPLNGRICLDGSPLDQWDSEILGQAIGYVPQEIELFSGTIAQNIARFSPDAAADSIIEAAREAGVHEMISSFPEGYNTQIGERGQVLSAGQKQRIALARALYGKPFLLVLDEPNSNLDSEGEKALIQAVDRVRDRNGIAVLIAHRASALANIDYLMFMQNGAIADYGLRDDVLMRSLGKKKKAMKMPLGEKGEGGFE